MDIAKRCNKMWNDNFYYRIDIITECESFESLFDLDWNGNIYMNEIENIGSGLKDAVKLVNDNGNYATLVDQPLNKDGDVYDYIVTEIFRIIKN